MIDFGSGQTLALALTAGVLAAFNPCGFALLPAYLTMIMTGSSESNDSKVATLGRSVGFALAMTLGFVAVFTVFGLVFVLASTSLQGGILPYLAYVTVAIGLLLIVFGIRMAAGHEVGIPGLRVKSRAPAAAFGSQAAYGASFALASMSCTIGPFLLIVSGAVTASGPVAKTLPFLTYGLGMGVSVVAISIAAALAGSTVVASLRRRTPAIMRAAGWLMIIAGVYAALFGLAEVLQEFGNDSLVGVIDTTSRWQGDLTRVIHGWGTPAIVTVAVAVVALTAWILVARRESAKSEAEEAPVE